MKASIINTTIPGVQEHFLTIPQAAKELGLPVSTLRRAVKSGLVPHHRPFSSRIRVLVSEVCAAINASEEG